MLGTTLGVLLALIVLSVPIAAVLGVLALTLDEIYSPMPLFLALLFMATVIVACLFRQRWGSTPVETSWRRRIDSLPHLLPPLGIFLVVVGSIYAGLATPTEAASLGVVASLILAAANRSPNFQILRLAIEGAMRTTAMVMLIIVAAIFLNFTLAAVGLTQALSDFITSLGLPPFQTLLAVIAFYPILGCFMETLSMLLTTTPLIVPIIVGLATIRSGSAS